MDERAFPSGRGDRGKFRVGCEQLLGQARPPLTDVRMNARRFVYDEDVRVLIQHTPRRSFGFLPELVAVRSYDAYTLPTHERHTPARTAPIDEYTAAFNQNARVAASAAESIRDEPVEAHRAAVDHEDECFAVA